jgi:hypothetical protein
MISAEVRLLQLLQQVAYEQRPCRFCQVPIFFVRVKTGATIPYTAEGVNHFQDCPHFAKARQGPQNAQEKLFERAPDALEPKR